MSMFNFILMLVIFMNDNELIIKIKNLIKFIDKINDEALFVLNGTSGKNMNDLRYSMYYLEEFTQNLEKIAEKIRALNYDLGMAIPTPKLESLREELIYKYELMYMLYDEVWEMIKQ